MHKHPPKQRYISASSNCTTKPISEILTKTFKLIENTHRNICRLFYKENSVTPMWIIKNSTAVHERIASFNHLKTCKSIRTYYFSTVYTSIPLKTLKTQLIWIITKAFTASKKNI